MENCSQIKDRHNDRKARRQTCQVENDDNDSEDFVFRFMDTTISGSLDNTISGGLDRKDAQS